MEAQKFIVPNMAQGLKTIRDTLGENALIISKQQTEQGVEIIATVAAEPHYQALKGSADVLLGAQTKQRQDALLDVYKDKVMDKPLQNNLVQDLRLDTQQPQVRIEPVYHDGQVLETFQSELQSIKSVLNEQYTDLCWKQYELKNAFKIKIIKELTELGFSQDFCKDLIEPLPNTADLNALRQALIQMIIESTLSKHQPIDWELGCHVFVGPGGGGKTQSLCKCLPHILEQYNNDEVLLVSYNEQRLGQFDQLMVYANIFQVEALLLDDLESLDKALARTSDKKVVIMDLCLPSIDLMHETFESFKQINHSFIPIGVLPANLELPMMHRWALGLKTLNGKHVIATKFDETHRVGSSLETVIGLHFSLTAFFSSGLLTEPFRNVSQQTLYELFAFYEECAKDE